MLYLSRKNFIEGAIFCILFSHQLSPHPTHLFFCPPKNVINGNPTTTLCHGTDLKCGSYVSEWWNRKMKTPSHSITLLLHISGLSTLNSFNMWWYNTFIMLKSLLILIFFYKWQKPNLINITYMHFSYSVKARWIKKLIGMNYLRWFASSKIWIKHIRQIKGRSTLSGSKHMGKKFFHLLKCI